MSSKLALAVSLSALVSVAAPAGAGTLQIFEDSHGDPGITAYYTPGNGLIADLDLNASSAEGGDLYQGATDILIVPIGDALLVSFVCQLASGCGDQNSGFNYTFVGGGEGSGFLLIHDEDLSPQSGLYELGDLTWDSLSVEGGLRLESCAYHSPSSAPQERSCSPFTVALTPEPGTGALLGLALGALGIARRRR